MKKTHVSWKVIWINLKQDFIKITYKFAWKIVFIPLAYKFVIEFEKVSLAVLRHYLYLEEKRITYCINTHWDLSYENSTWCHIATRFETVLLAIMWSIWRCQFIRRRLRSTFSISIFSHWIEQINLIFFISLQFVAWYALTTDKQFFHLETDVFSAVVIFVIKMPVNWVKLRQIKFYFVQRTCIDEITWVCKNEENSHRKNIK